jgi:hypothetical protein
MVRIKGPAMLQRIQSSGTRKPSALFIILLLKMRESSLPRKSKPSSAERKRPSGKIVVVQNRGGRVALPQQVHKLAINYMTHPIHAAGALCFHRGGVRRQCSAYDGAFTSIGAARPPQNTL